MIVSSMEGVAPAPQPSKCRSQIKVNACGGIDLIAKEHSTTIFLFASILRSDPTSHPVMWRIKATNEKDARRKLSRDYVLSFAGVIHHRSGPDGFSRLRCET
ncbi:host cell division inhibitor Icd-like protein [uncultured Serratia sp.]|uniref:host cell division inhibitor Icd-like protein n=1 Tax=uncultured Serratia sp. TaxID=239175 RepID=UPI0025830C67|nr:host cell division inhibitor Icd-like protein [uncultured Serratia sp.]